MLWQRLQWVRKTRFLVAKRCFMSENGFVYGPRKVADSKKRWTATHRGMKMIVIGDTFSTFRASMTRSRASSSPSRMLKSINNSGLVRLSMLNLDWKGGGGNERINKNICRYIFLLNVVFLEEHRAGFIFSSLRFLLNIVHLTIWEVTAKLNLILRQMKEMQKKTFWRDVYFVVLHM